MTAAAAYGLELLPASAKTHDAKASGGLLVQIKATQGKYIGIRSEPQHMLVPLLKPDGTFEKVLNGPGALAWISAGKMQKNGQRPLSIARLRKLQATVRAGEKLAATAA